MKNLSRRIISATLALSLSLTLAVNAYAEEITKAHKQETISAETIHTKEKSENAKKPEKIKITKDNLPEVLDFDRVKEQGFVSRLKSEETDMCEIVLENEDGTRGLYVFDSPVKFKNEKGEIVDKSNKVKPHNKNGSPGFRSESNDIEVNLPVALQTGVSLKDEELNVVMKPLPSAVSKRTLSTGKQKDENSVIYEDVFDNNTDIVYTFTYDGVKEDIVLEKYNGKNTFDFEVITGGLSLEEEKGALLLKDENGEVKATMGEIVIFSADNKNNTFGEYKITEKQKNNSYIITVCVDVAYLTSPDTKYPVTIDPSINSSTHKELCGIQDMQVFKGTDGTNGTGTGNTETSAGLSGVSRVGWTDWGACRTLVKFKSTLLSDKNIKYPEQINKASIEIRDLMSQSQSAMISCYQFNGNIWSETQTRTWNGVQADKLGDLASNKIVSSISGAPASKDLGNPSTDTWELWHKFNLTDTVKKWTQKSALISQGLIFKSQYETAAKAAYMKTFSSVEGNKNYKPYFYIEYDYLVPVSTISLSPSSLTLDVGKTHTFYPTVYPGNATNQQFTWTSSNTAVATVSSSGKVTAKKAGTAVITAKSKDNPSITSAKCKVTVEIPDSDGDGLDDEMERLLGTNPHNKDTDGDGVYDEEEYYLSTNPLKADSDQDGLSDCLEIELWYDPLDPNPDNDSFNDYEEHKNETDPYVYDMTADESAAAFWDGALLGDFVVPDNIETLLGQISFSFVPVVADVRDYFANVFVNGDTLTAIFNLGGALLDVVPGAGVAGDVAKALPKLGRFVVKFADDAPMVMEAIVRGTKLFPNADEVLPGLVKILPVGTLDNIAKSIKNGDNITKANYKKLQQVFESAGKNFDEIVGLSNSALKHPINKHMPINLAKQLPHKNKAAVLHRLKTDTFFNASWTEQIVRDAMNAGYKEAISKGVTTGKYVFKYLGEDVVVCLEEGIFKTGYGVYTYSYDQLLKLLNL